MTYQVIKTSVRFTDCGWIGLEYKNLTSSGIKVDITSILVSRHGEGAENEFVEAGFTIDSRPQGYYIDLDPHETREYIIRINDVPRSISYKIYSKDRRSGHIVEVCGDSNGFPDRNTLSTDESLVREVIEGRSVRVSDVYREALQDSRFVISPENGSTNDFGVFCGINSPACYSDEGSDYYKNLIGKFEYTLHWCSDTLAYPPDDLTIIHVRGVESGQHGWFFRESLIYIGASK